MSIEPVQSHGALVHPAEGHQPAFNDPMLVDVVREGARSIADRLPGVGFALRVKESRDAERRLRMLELAVERLGEGLDGFQDRLRNDPDVAELFGRVWDVVADARSDEKIRILANVVAGAMGDQRFTVASGHVVLDVLARLQPLHLQVLVDVEREAETMPPADGDGGQEPAGARRDVLEALTGLDPDVLGVMINDLEATQLIVNRFHKLWGGLEGKEAWAPTKLGRQVLALLSDVAQPVRDDSET